MPSPKARTERNTLRDRPEMLIAALLVVITLAVFLRMLGNGFVLYDDDDYITQNDAVQQGITADGINWAFTTYKNSNWHPLTWISHMLDCQLWGLNPLGHHLTSLLFHVANVLLLFLVLNRMTKSPWKSGFVAALFAIHPLHVESVAWASERKDVLSAFFWMLTILAYLRYVEKPTVARQVSVVLAYGVGLLAKPMLVTLPLVLLLLDYWPLRRLKLRGEKASKDTCSISDLVWEKLPLFGLAAASCYMTYHAQNAGGTVAILQLLPLGVRIANALVSYVSYILKAIWPAHLAALYPHRDNLIPEGEVLGSAVFLILVTILAIRAARSRPYLTVGWLWYVATLIPVIGIVQVGEQAMADRYTYIPLIGLFIVVAWGVPDLVGEWGKGRKGEREKGKGLARVLPVIAVVAILGYAATAWRQAGYWHDDYTLCRHGIAVTKDNYAMHLNLGCIYQADGQDDLAIREFEEVLRILPIMYQAHNNLALLYLRQGRFADAWKEVRECRELDYEPDERLIRMLTEAMPEPRE